MKITAPRFTTRTTKARNTSGAPSPLKFIMATFTWLPLELWRASGLAQETRALLAAADALREEAAAGGPGAAAAAREFASLRRSVEARVDALEAFYVAHVEDERVVLFEKQRLRLRKFLADAGVPSPPPTARGAVPAAGSPPRAGTAGYFAQPSERRSAPAAAPSPTATAARAAAAAGAPPVTKEIREDTRLNAAELLAWFTQAGTAEMPAVRSERE